MSEEKLVRKILRSLHMRFEMKVTTIEEDQDLSTMKVDAFIRSLLMFDMVIDDKSVKNFVAFKEDIEDCDD